MTNADSSDSNRPEGATSQRPRLLATAIGLIVAVLVAEATLWLTNQPRFPVPHTFPPQFMLVGEPDAQGWVRHVNKPSTTIRFRYESDPREYFGTDRTVGHTTNSLGFRGGEFPLVETRDGGIEAIGEKPDGVLRIVFLGDSVTFGEGVHDSDTFVERVGRGLSTRLSRPIEVYNFGVGGHNTSDARWVWQRYARHLDPDLVIYTFVLNDAEPRLFRLEQTSGQPTRIPRSIEARWTEWTSQPEGWWTGSRLARLAWKLQAGWKLDRKTLGYYRELNASYSPHWHACREQLEALQQIEPTPLVVVFPMLFDLAAHPFRPVHLAITDTCSRTEIIDLWETLAGRAGNNTPELWVHPTDTHPNEIAHKFAAGVITQRLETLLRDPEQSDSAP
ncbi:MAG: hypothetical protein CMJ69_04970 [Planctomycetaceae bacterium]|nr:hypothetical protein [Planctomycetaceae bacterium]|tara:strand:- start:412 stop:1581 length:1170 start_codon:yes stop_codon:yes gene_type:complete